MACVRPSRIITGPLLVLILALGLVARTVAQGGEAAVTIVGVESRAFPQVTVSVVVSDERGPRDGLTAADFWVSEDGVAIPATSMAVESDASQGLRLVLALDVSMNPDSLAEVREATRAFVDTLEPRDRAAIIAFYDEVRIVVRDFTNNQDVLKAAIDELTAEGNYTALNDAAFEAVSRVSALPAGRKAVVVLTNSADNVSTRSTDEVVATARAVHTPVYAIGFGRARSDVLEKLTSSTGGRPFVVSGLDEIPDAFQAIAGSLGQGGYKVTFQSGLKADDAGHDLVVGVTYQGKEGQAEGRFVAVPGRVTVNLPNLTEGQTVGGVVDLAVQATAPAPVASVAYRLDDRSLAEVTAPPYSFEWDTTTLEPGPYRLTVHVVDQAGNEGQAEVNLDVARPVVVTASASRASVEAGEQVTVEAEVEALAEVARVEFLLDGEPIASDDTPPYRVAFDSGAYPPGEYRITVRAEDSLGRTAETDLTVEFVAPPVSRLKAPWFELAGWPQVLVTGDVVVFLIALVLIARVQKRRRRKTYRLEISNLGNVPSRYELRAEDAEGALDFQFLLNGARLPRTPEVSATPRVHEGPVAQVPVARPAPAGPPARPTGGGVRQTAGQAMQAGSFITGIANSMAALLPGSMGASVRGAVQPVARAQSRVTSIQGRAKGTVGRVSQLSKQVSGAKPPSPPAGTTIQRTGTRARPQAAPAASPPPWPQLPGETWAQTPFVAPGELLTLDLLITPLHPNQTRRYSFKVISRAMEQEKPWAMVERGSVQIVRIPWFRRLLPYLILTLVMAMAMLAIAVRW